MKSTEEYLSHWYGELDPEFCMAPEHYCERLAEFKAQPASSYATILLGDSLTEFADWNSLLQGSAGFLNPDGNRLVLNRGIAGDMIEGMILRLDELVRHNPAKIFLMAGCNNFVKYPSITLKQVWEAYEQLISRIRELMPHTVLHIASTLPLNPMCSDYYRGINNKILQLNKLLQLNSSTTEQFRYKYYDIVPELSDSNGCLRSDLTIDGCHLNTAGYRIWAARIERMID